MVAFDYKFVPVREMRVETIENQKTGRPKVDRLFVEGEPLKPSTRFWTSLASRFHFGDNIFNYFTHHEVFDRIAEKHNNVQVRVCVERSDEGNRLMGVSNPSRPVVDYKELMDLVERYDGQSVNYADGIMESTHLPRVSNNFGVAGDVFGHRFVMSTPIDGYGKPCMYLSLLRQICANGMVGYSAAFRQDIPLGRANDVVSHSIARQLDGFNNDEGFAALRQRLELSTKSWCSVNESQKLYKTLIKAHNSGMLMGTDDPTLGKSKSVHDWLLGSGEASLGSPIMRAFHTMTGDTSQTYGLANIDALSVKKQRTLPVRCMVYDAVNFATEVATHYATPAGARLLNSWVGGTIGEEYDLENTQDSFNDFSDFYIDRKLAVAELTGSK